MKNRWMMLMVCLVATVTSVLADVTPFRNHRYDAFRILPVNSENIVFVGNSITHMHEWWEAFGNNKVINRGNSGTVSGEILDNLEAILPGKPAKIFLMIGTNDLGTQGINTAEHVARNVRTAVKRTQKESPETEIYIQSILPSNVGLRTVEVQKQTNDSLRQICLETGATYVDLWDKLIGILSGGQASFDQLHLTATSYRIWCKEIAKYVGSDCTYPDNATNNACGIGASQGMRTTTFGMSKINADDILLIGDEMLHGGEWHELLHSDKVKDRGIGWGYAVPNISVTNASLQAIFKGRADNETPKAAFFYSGTPNVNNTANNLDNVAAEYRAMIENARKLAPTTKIYILSLLPNSTAATNTNRVVPFNEKLKKMAGEMANVEYVDIYTPMVSNGAANTKYISSGNFMMGLGYAKLSEIIAEAIGDKSITPTTEEDAQKLLDRFASRNAIATVINSLEGLTIGTGTGAYTAENAAALRKGVEEAYALLATDATADQLSAKSAELQKLLTELLPKINMPTASTTGDEHWYKLSTPRRAGLYLSSGGVGAGITGVADNNYANTMWKFVKRADNTFDIVNRNDNSYINPSAANNTQISTSAAAPSTGWKLSYTDAAGTYIITNGTNVQLNQTTLSGQGYPLYNWGGGSNRSDTGCQFAIEEVTGLPDVEPSNEPIVTLRDITLDGQAPYKIADEEAQKVFACPTVTVAIDFTLSSATGEQILVGSSNSKASAPASTAGSDICAVGVVNGNTIRVRNEAGYYSRSTTTVGTARHQIVITMQGANPAYSYYLDGTKLTDIAVANQNIFGTVNGVDGLYLGGTVFSDNANYLPAAGTIHSVRFYNHSMSAAEVAAITYDDDEAEPIEAFAPDTKWFTMQCAAAGYYVSNNGSADHIALDRVTTTLEDKDLWCFVGNATSGYRIYNKEAGPGKVLAAPATMTGTNGGTSYVVLKDISNLGNYRDLWNFTETDVLGAEIPAGYMYPVGSESHKVNNRDGKLAFWSAGADGGSAIQVKFAKRTLRVTTETGSFTSSNPNGTWHKTWTATATEPGLTLDAGYNNMATDGTNLSAFAGQYHPQAYTLTTDDGYSIGSYSFDFTTAANSQNVTITAGDLSMTSSSAEQHFAVDGLKEPTASFTLSGGNYGAVLKNFDVTIVRSEIPEEPQFEVFSSPAGAIPYRIPAITRAHNGDIIAVADYRHSRADIGMVNNGRIDLHARISKDHGQTWGEVFPIVEGKGANSPDFMNVAFGDPCIAADSESDRVIVMSCGGNVSFPNGTRDNHQNIARFYSNDNGQTWSEPVDIAESIYSQFDESPFGPIKAMFVGSGKISQSRTIKVGDYYRLYCAVLARPNSGSNVNFVLYSDDFGGSWSVLGGTDVSPIPSGGDEPKAEELPDGSVVISSRAQGRLFNIFSYTDVAKGEGQWGTMTQSLASSNNGICAQGGNPTNGEIMIVPATRTSDGADVWVALQSVPFGPNRANVGIYYKELDGLQDFDSAESFASDWDGRHQSSRRSSAYSTMTWQADNTLGFVYEEDLYGCSGGYTIVYKNYSLEQITDSAYAYNADFARNIFAETEAIRAKVDALTDYVGTNVGNLTQAAGAALEAAYAAYAEHPGQEAYIALNNAIFSAERVVINPTLYYRLRNCERSGGQLYLKAKTDGSGLTAATLDVNDNDQLFRFEPSGSGWLVVNRGRQFYVSATGAVETEIPVSPEASGGAPYRVESDLDGRSALICLTPGGNYPAIHLAGDNTRLVPWNAGNASASFWYIEPTDILTDIELVAQPAASVGAAPLYDLSGRRVAQPVRGVYIRSGRKELVR